MPGKMLKVTLQAPGRLVVGEDEIPSPGEGEVLVKVKRCGVCGSDITIFRGRHPYVTYPLVMGHEFSGVVAALGAGIDAPRVGTRVTVIPHLVCGVCGPCRHQVYNFCEELRCTGAEADGGHVEYKVMPAPMVLPIADTVSMDDAAMVEPAAVAYHGAKRGDIQPGDEVLIIGAGPIGLFAMQSCRALGAGSVRVADLDPWRLDLALKLGADGVINVSEETLEDGLTRLAGGCKRIDVFYDCVGQRGHVLDHIIQMARRGTRVVVIGVLQNGYDIPHLPDFVQHELRLSGTTMYTPQDYHDVIEHMGSGEIKTAGMITQYFKLADVPQVFEMIEARSEPFFKIMLTVGE